MYLSYIYNVSHHILSPSSRSGVVECGRKLTDPNTLAALAAAEQRRQQLHSTREDRRARARKRNAALHCNAALHAGCKDQNGSLNGCTGAVQKKCSPPEMLAAHDTQLLTRYGMTGTVQTQEGGGAGGAQPPQNCLTHLIAALHCKDQAAI